MRFKHPAHRFGDSEPFDTYRFLRGITAAAETALLSMIEDKKAGDPEVTQTLEELEAELAEVRADKKRLAN